jgi:FkbM family methyltransferase
MRNVGRKLAFVLASSNHGTIIVNRFDYHMTGPDTGHGVGFQILEAGNYDPVEVELALKLLELRRHFHGDGMVAIDCGANIGVHTIEWAIAMTGWGSVIAIEPQERIYYALAGNIAINNCFNAVAMHAAVSSETGIMNVPNPDYFTASSFGSLEIMPRANNEFIGQTIDYSDASTVPIRKVSIDSMKLPRVDLIKIDVEGMEMEALQGASETIERTRPILLVESIKTGGRPLRTWMSERGYQVVDAGPNLLAIHKTDETLSQLKLDQGRPQSSAA